MKEDEKRYDHSTTSTRHHHFPQSDVFSKVNKEFRIKMWTEERREPSVIGRGDAGIDLWMLCVRPDLIEFEENSVQSASAPSLFSFFFLLLCAVPISVATLSGCTSLSPSCVCARSIGTLKYA